jgi:hypothetical protein
MVSLSSLSFGASLDGKYNLDISNFVIFEKGEFKQQYITSKYIVERLPESFVDDGPDSYGLSSALENETICLVNGTYSVSSSSIQLSYESDSCENKKGDIVALIDEAAGTIVIEGKTFSKDVLNLPIRLDRSTSPGGSISGAPSEEVTEQAPLSASPAQVRPSVSPGTSIIDIEAGLKAWQSNTAQAMEDLNNNWSGIWYCSSGNPRLNSSYWTWTYSVGRGGWIPNRRIKPSKAVNWYFGQVSSSEACTECLMAARASFYKGLLDTIGKVAFDNWFDNRRSDLVISNYGYAPSPTRVNKPIFSEADLSRGDWVYFQNWVSSRSCPAVDPMQGENAITQSSGTPKSFIGLGMPGRNYPPVIGQVILDDLYRSWQSTGCPQEREGQLRTDLVATASASYFNRIINGTQVSGGGGIRSTRAANQGVLNNSKSSALLTSLSNGIKVTNLSNSSGSRAYYKVSFPSGTTHFEVKTTGKIGNSDLYVMHDQWPTKTYYDYNSTSNSNDELVVANADAAGTWYIMLDGQSDYSGVTLVARGSKK